MLKYRSRLMPKYRPTGRLAAVGVIALAGTLAIGGFLSSQYMDMFGFGEKVQAGRTKNSIAAVVGGIAAQKAYGNADVTLEVRKTGWPDARLDGHTTPTSIAVSSELALTSVRFSAHQNEMGELEGRVDKSEFDWNVHQRGDDRYEITRFGPKFNSELELSADAGKISGTYVRSGPHFDWPITGTYDEQGKVKITIGVPLGLDVTLVGKIQRR